MAQPLLDFLIGRARAALPFLRGAVAQGLPSTQIVDALRASGLSFNRQAMFDIIKALQSRADIASYLRIVPPTTVLPPEAHTVETVVNMATNYSYLVRIVDPESPVPRYVTVVSDIPLSASAIYAISQTYATNPAGRSFVADTIAPGDQRIVEASVSENAP